MKKIIASICSLLLVFGASTASAAESKDEVVTTPITIRTSGGNGNQITRPRSGEFIPVIGLYDNGRVVLDFIEDIGTVGVTVANQSTGETYFDYFNSADGHFEMEVSTSNGEYLLTIQTENGTMYYGNYAL